MNKVPLPGLLALGVALLAFNLNSLSRATSPPPNVLVILTDDQRWDAMSCAGHPLLKTPNLDRLAAEGARFANMFVTTSLCSPSRASLLSGLYAHRHGVLNNFTEYPDSLPSYPKRLREAGYETAYFGKWHMGETNGAPRTGFDFWMSHRGQGNYFGNEWNINGQTQFIKGYYTTVVTEHALEWLQRKHEKPFLLILGQKAPHGGPIEPEPKYEHAFDNATIAKPANYDAWKDGKPAWLAESFPTWHGAGGPLYNYRDYDKFVRAYLGTLLSVDDSVGRLYDALKQTGQLDRTLIIFTSDNGFVLGEHGRVDKRTMYEESLRVPLLVRYPPLVPKPSRHQRNGPQPRPGPQHPRHLRREAPARTLTASPGSRCWPARPAAGARRSSTSTTTRRSFPTRPTCAASAPPTGSTSTTRTATAARTATRRSSTTSRPTRWKCTTSSPTPQPPASWRS